LQFGDVLAGIPCEIAPLKKETKYAKPIAAAKADHEDFAAAGSNVGYLSLEYVGPGAEN
jgi:hypothetical protein